MHSYREHLAKVKSGCIIAYTFENCIEILYFIIQVWNSSYIDSNFGATQNTSVFLKGDQGLAN